MLSNSDDNGNGMGGSSHQNHHETASPPNEEQHDQQQMSQNSVQAEPSTLHPSGASSNSNINVNNNQDDNQIENPVELPAEQENVMDQSDNVSNNNPLPLPPPNGNNLDVNIELINNEEVLDPQPDFDADAEDFRRRFYEAISRRNLPDSPPAQYEEFDEDDNIDLIEEIIEDDADEEDDDDDDEDSYGDGISTGPPSSRDDHEMDSDENVVVERQVASSSAVPVFDLQLPQLHSYLGDSMETLSGRTVLEEGNVIEIPLVLLEFHLVPGQTLPLTIFHSSVQSALRRCIPNNRHFGIVHSGLNDLNIRSPLPRRALGTTAEIFEFQEGREGESHVIPGRGPIPFPEKISIKAKGRHRFNVLSTYRQSDGHLMAKVKIRPEISLPKPWRSLISSNHRHMFPLIYTLRTDSSISKPVRERRYSHPKSKHLKTTAPSSSSDNDTIKANQQHTNSSTTPSSSSSVINPLSIFNSSSSSVDTHSHNSSTLGGNSIHRKINRYYSAMTPWPYFVFELFDETILVDKIHKKLTADLSSLAPLANVIPHDPTDLSFWLAQNLTMNDSLRLQMLKMDTSIERLRFASKLMDKVSRVIECNQCHSVIANHSDIFSMSVEGPQGTYVNPHGFVHELITVTKIKGTVYRGVASTEASWFPGYSWRIMECRGCSNHVGWKFKAKERLKPKKFYGLARRSVSFKYDFSLDNECPSL